MAENDMLSALMNARTPRHRPRPAATPLRGGGAPRGAPPPPADDAYDPSADLMRRVMPVLGRIAQRGQTAVDPQKRALLNAVKPFVNPNIRTQIDRGMRLVSLACMATALFGAPEEDTHHV